MVIKSITFVFTSGLGKTPWKNIPRVELPHPNDSALIFVESPKSCELPVLAIVINSITLIPGEVPPFEITPRVGDCVPPQLFFAADIAPWRDSGLLSQIQKFMTTFQKNHSSHCDTFTSFHSSVLYKIDDS